MPEVTSYESGVPCWTDLTTTDPDAAKTFYSKLFGWDVSEPGPPETGGYTQFLKGDKPLCAVSKQQPQQVEMGVPPTWNTYIATADADTTTAKAKEAGGTVFAEPFDVMEFGRMSVIQDPTGAVFETWQTGTHPGSAVVNEPVSVTWNELNTRDVGKAKDFYTKVFGWEWEAMPDSPREYFGIRNNGHLRGGMLVMGDDIPAQVPPHWMVYFSVEDADAIAAKTKQLGGNVMMEPFDIPPGRMAILLDPQGAAFSVIKTNPNL